MKKEEYQNEEMIRQWNDKYSEISFIYSKTPLNIFISKKYIDLNYIIYKLDKE